MMTAATTWIVPRKKSATRATSASCRRHGIFIELIGDAKPINSEVGEGCDQMTGGVQADVAEQLGAGERAEGLLATRPRPGVRPAYR